MSGRELTPEFLTVDDAPREVGRGPEVHYRVAHPMVSRRHATLVREKSGIFIRDHESRHGTFVNGVRIGSVRLQPGDRVQFGGAVAYRVQADGLRLDAAALGLDLVAEGIAIARDGRVLVEGVSFSIAPDSFVGVLAPSGAGKSTLLNCLASFYAPAAGRLLFDGGQDAWEDLARYRSLLGYVPQEDLVFSLLTCRENLAYAARLRLGREWGLSLEEAAAETLEKVDLTRHEEKLAVRLSGGQRKRLSVAVELLKRPRLLLLDEPTSGLDPASEAKLMEQLRHVARRGTTVLCATHLMENILLFDRVLVLGVADGVGRLVYDGPPGDLLGRFDSRGFADLYDRLAGGDFSPLPAASEDGRPAEGDRVAPAGSSGTSGPPSSGHVPLGQITYSASAETPRRQELIVAERGLRLLLRDRALCLTMAAQPVVLAALVCLTQFTAAAPPVLLYFLTVVLAVWLGLNNSARDLVRERKLYLRDRLAGLAPDAYLTGKAAVLVLAGAVQIALMVLAVRVVSAWVLPEAALADLPSPAWLFVVLLACYLCGLGLGLLASTLSPSEAAAVAVLPLLIMPQILLSSVAVGQAHESHSKPDRAFRPLAAALTDDQELSTAGNLVEGLSLACYSRPAVLLLESPGCRGTEGPSGSETSATWECSF
jgi:ABC transport system ATP-binding/permease protein